jgi:N-acetylglutamate synthase-like GNAT family acetyltransferase
VDPGSSGRGTPGPRGAALRAAEPTGVASPLPPIRPATEADAAAIRGLIREARLNPRDLDWHRFLVGDEGGVIACAQVRVHRRGTRELASVAVAPSHRGRGLGRAIAVATVEREPVRPLFLYTESRTEAFWVRLGFTSIEGDAVPRDLRAPLRIARLATAIFSFVTRRPARIVVMRRD